MNLLQHYFHWTSAAGKTGLLLAALTLLQGNPAVAQTDAVSISMDGRGLTSLRYQGADFLGDGEFRLHAAKLKNSSGRVSSASMQTQQAFDASKRELSRTYSWGAVRAAYTPNGNRLGLTITITNTSSETIQGLYFEPFSLRLPAKPKEYDGVTPILGHNFSSPTVLRLTAGNTAVVLTNDDPAEPLIVGFPWALDRPASMQLFPLRINTDREGMYPPNLPYIDRPIPPGGSDQFRLSLRFGGAQASTKSLAEDVYAAYANRHPFQANWPDRRPIGSLILATSATNWRTNPRGWLLDSTLDVTTPAGLANFRTRILAWADNSVRILKEMNAQGGITWDIEGEQFPHATTYIGDPRLFAQLAPEMAGVADEYFQKFRAAGLRTGVCIRPQQLVVSPDGKSANQTEPADPAQVLIDKITFAKNRWGATLFYIDSNGDPNLPTDMRVLQRVLAVHPDVLLIPEHETSGYFGLSAPYNELRQGPAATPEAVRDLYPRAFSVINTADGAIDSRYNELRTAVQRGDIMMFRAWFDDAANTKVKSLYPTQPNAVPPTVAFAAPLSGATISGTVELNAESADDIGVAAVRFSVDGTALGEVSRAPWRTTLDTTRWSNGLHRLMATARDGDGNTAEAVTLVSIHNVERDTLAPAVAFRLPQPNTVTSNSLPVAVEASDNLSIAAVGFRLDGRAFGPTLTSAPYTTTLTLSGIEAGPHTLTAVARDAEGNTGTAALVIVVSPTTAPPAPQPGATDNQAPIVALLSPGNNTTLSGQAVLAATASDNQAVAKVRFWLDGVLLQEVTSTPYQATLNTATVLNGLHYVTAEARDGAGNTSARTVSFSVNNSQAATCGETGFNSFLGCYYAGPPSAQPVLTRLDQGLNFDWNTRAPFAGLPADGFSATWQGRFPFEAANYAFSLRVDGAVRLFLDNQLLLDQPQDQGQQLYQVQQRVGAGTHVLRVEYRDLTGAASVRLSWRKQ